VSGLNQAYIQADGYILMRLPGIPALPSSLKFLGRTFHRVDDLHLSLVAVNHLAARLVKHRGIEQAVARGEVLAAATNAINHHAPKLEAYRNEIRLVDHPSEDRHTLIVVARVPQLDQVYAEMSSVLGLSLPAQPAHVTIYANPAGGETVGVRSEAELAERTRPLTRFEAAALGKLIDPYASFRWSMFMTPGPVRNNLILEMHVPGFKAARDFYRQFGFEEIAYDPISGGGVSDLGYLELKREDALGRTQLNFYGDKDSVARHARFNEFPEDTPRGYAVEITIPVDGVARLWEDVGRHLPTEVISQPLVVKRWGKLDFRVVDPYGFYLRFTEPVDWWQDI